MDIGEFNKLFSLKSSDFEDVAIKAACTNVKKKLRVFRNATRQPQREQSQFMVLVKSGDDFQWKPLHPTKNIAPHESDETDSSRYVLADRSIIDESEIIDWCYSDNWILYGGYSIKQIHSKFNLERQFQVVDTGIRFLIPDLAYDEDAPSAQLMRHLGNDNVQEIEKIPNVRELVNVEFLANFGRWPAPPINRCPIGSKRSAWHNHS